ncbi:MAG: hypothetical protein IH852_16845 [Bacteroidetes bacterium]|nr:hypothetical protein [Bacteroidota bacterium]
MDLIKQYIIQSLTAASNNLRLTNHQIETLGLLREVLLNSDDLGADIDKMKTITELSTLAIRLNEIYDYLTRRKIDFFKFSDQFKEHSRYLINDLTHLLEIDNPALIKAAINKLNGVQDKKESEEIEVILSVDKVNLNPFVENDNSSQEENIEEAAKDEKDFFKSYEDLILKPIKPIDNMLNKFVNNDINYEDLSRFAEIMKMNGEVSEKNGFEIISSMHSIIYKALIRIKSRKLMPGKDVIESMRACLIVIVAVVRGKDVDITNYLNKAEDFEKEIQTTNNKEFKL